MNPTATIQPSAPTQAGPVKDLLAAVQLLLDTERKATEYDILLATCFERLHLGQASERELLLFVQACWPGAGIVPFTLSSALEVGRAAGFIDLAAGSSVWKLTDKGVGDVEGSRQWAEQILERAVSALSDDATKAFGYVRPGECAQWLEILLDALFRAIRHVFVNEGRQIELFGSRAVVPRIYDLDLISSRIEQLVEREDVRTFLKGMALQAIDPSHPFGSELVHHIATGYILQAFLARQDAQQARDLVVSLLQGVAVLDTPVLVALLDQGERAFRIRQALTTAIASGVRIVLLQETRIEMEQLLERLGRYDARQLEADITSGIEIDVLIAVVRDDVLRSFLVAKRDAKIASWPAFASRLTHVISMLQDVGVEIMVDLSGVNGRKKYADALVADLAKASRKRGEKQIEHDATLLSFVARERHGKSGFRGPFILTTDRHMSAAYRTVHGSQAKNEAPVALTLSEWSALVAAIVEPGSVELLAQAAMSEVGYETIIALASRFPPSASRHLARVLQGVDFAAADLALLPLTIDEVFKKQPLLLEVDPAGAVLQIASDLVAQRARRLDAAASLYRGFAEDERERAVTLAARSDADRQIAETKIRDLEAQLLTERRRSDELIEDRDLQETRAKRRPWVILSAVLLIIAGSWLWISGWPFWGVGSIVSGLVLWLRGELWAKDRSRKISELVVSLTPELLVVFDVLSRA
jgi:hypothetical protein